MEPEIFRKENGNWNTVTDPSAVQQAARSSRAHQFSIYVHQTLNTPPVLMATDADSGVSKKVWNPNPEFAGIEFGQATVYKWSDTAGHQWTGGLVKPPDYVAGRRYPLVIQTHGFRPSEFLTDGIFTTANAARPLAARGIVVLQVGETFSRDANSTPREAAEARDGYITVIERLNAEGLIDPQRVGIIGFSRTGWYVLDSLIHAGRYFAAATLADCTYASFGEYVLGADYGEPGRSKVQAAMIGSEPFGRGLQKWLSDSPGFNTDKILVPVLFQASSPLELIYSWDVYALMRLQNKPVELLYFRNGEHVLEKPQEVLASQEMSVDWYDFWLNGHVDPDPAKAEQYARWQELRRLQSVNQPN